MLFNINKCIHGPQKLINISSTAFFIYKLILSIRKKHSFTFIQGVRFTSWHYLLQCYVVNVMLKQETDDELEQELDQFNLVQGSGFSCYKTQEKVPSTNNNDGFLHWLTICCLEHYRE